MFQRRLQITATDNTDCREKNTRECLATAATATDMCYCLWCPQIIKTQADHEIFSSQLQFSLRNFSMHRHITHTFANVGRLEERRCREKGKWDWNGLALPNECSHWNVWHRESTKEAKAHQAKAMLVLVILTSFLGIAKKDARVKTKHDDYRRLEETGSMSIILTSAS